MVTKHTGGTHPCMQTTNHTHEILLIKTKIKQTDKNDTNVNFWLCKHTHEGVCSHACMTHTLIYTYGFRIITTKLHILLNVKKKSKVDVYNNDQNNLREKKKHSFK